LSILKTIQVIKLIKSLIGAPPPFLKAKRATTDTTKNSSSGRRDHHQSHCTPLPLTGGQ